MDNKMNEWADIGIQSTDGCLFKVHRNTLAEKSEYFKKLFEWNDQQEIIHVPGICGEVMSCIFNYIYNGKIQITVENILQILMAADYFLLEELVQKCRRFIAFSLTVKNCVAAYNAALLVDRLKIEKICHRFIQVHFEEIAQKEIESFVNLPMETLTTILSEECLNVSNEDILWKVVIEWVKKDLTARLRCMPHLLLSIFADFSEKSKQDLHADLNFINLSQGPKALESSFDFVRSEVVGTIKLLNPTQFTVKMRQPRKLYFIVKLFYQNRSEIHLTFDNNLDICRKLSFCNEFFPNTVVMIDHIVYMFNSFSGENVAFAILNQQLFSLPPTTRNRCSIVVLGRCIYALGGCLEDLPREFSPPIAERYNPNLLCWEPIRPMRCNMVQAVAFGGFIFALGQYDIGSDRFMIFEKYPSPRVHILEDLLIIFDYNAQFPPICGNGNEWNHYHKLSNPDRYLFYCLKDLDVIAKIWRQSVGQENKWQQFIQDKFL
ncbi:kelch-like protein 23 [Uloborus diversus]|uniref:kelch-like protein 23 n=1 Tax=Uloborus diversus TaxID=327109 RepID=UPI00240A2EEF|nr:kelch-like protein 23 [Uloborus diversus]